ncbi:maleylpyruvate isomerase N-terminal domain-containing protein [Actinospongicola halichondriae]|uniref:maleylpyruvate isomerase N-terminal domain-containing protein n=1 Tax=Actinospongicola halichondriae TaxID=3236844 RepID=UPI003D5766E2
MQLTPRYDGDPIIVIEGSGSAIREPFVRQRDRLCRTLADLDDEQWHADSRCDGWSVQDVMTHLVSTDGFWSVSLASGIAGTPTRFLDGFDPTASPAALVAAKEAEHPSETLATFVDGWTSLREQVMALDEADFGAVAEAPPGHVAVDAMLHHALWDCWVHERDIVIPLGIAPSIEADEVVSCLRYAIALSPAFAAGMGEPRTGTLRFEVSHPDAVLEATIGNSVVVLAEPVDGGGPVVRGDAVDLLEGLSVRAPLDHDLGPDDEWLLSGLVTVFQTD